MPVFPCISLSGTYTRRLTVSDHSCAMPPTLLYGTGNFLMGVDSPEEAQKLLGTALKHGITSLDSAARYPAISPGGAERLIGKLDAVKQGFSVDTKILAGRNETGAGELNRENIEESLSGSLERLGVEKVNILYCHRSDPTTPIAEQAKYMDEQYRRGRFSALGVSLFRPEILEKWLRACDEFGYIKPKVYQGDYNLLTRGMEELLLPILRKHNMVFYAFRPMAAGFLSGSLVNGNTEGTRFTNEHVAAHITQLFDTEELKLAYTKLESAIQRHGITVRAASLRWIVHHSALKEGDGIILGASKASQLDENALTISQGPLPDDVVNAIENTWVSLKASRSTIL